MPTKRLIKVRSQFEDGFLKSFELISVTPEFNRFERYQGYCVRADYAYSVFIDDTLWIDTTRQRYTKYSIRHKVSRNTYKEYLEDWNQNPDISVVDIGINILGEL